MSYKKRYCVCVVAIVLASLALTGIAFAKAPMSERSRIKPMWGYTATEIAWYYALEGDYNLDGEVNISDLTPLGQHLGESVRDLPKTDMLRLIDGNGDGEINISDITSIGANLGADCQGGFNIYKGEDTPELIGHVSLDGTLSQDDDVRQLYLFDLGTADITEYYIRVVSQDGTEGVNSHVLDPAVNLPPMTEGAIASLEHHYYHENKLLWYYFNPGDGNQDGAIWRDAENLDELSDIIMVDLYYMRCYDPFSPHWYIYVESIIDYDGNGEVNICDIERFPRICSFGTMVAGYNVYAADDPLDYQPFARGESLIEPIGYVGFLSAKGNRSEDRLWFEFDLNDYPPEKFYWVRPTVFGKEGPPSTTAGRSPAWLPLDKPGRPVLSWDSEQQLIRWYHVNPEDFNLSGRVDTFDVNNNDRDITDANRQAAAKRWGACVTSYNAYASLSLDGFPGDTEPSTLEPYENIKFYKRDSFSNAPRSFTMEPPATEIARYVWIRPALGEQEGLPSIPLQLY